MRPADLKRELERLTVDASQARSQLAEMRVKLSDARSIIDALRGDLRATLREKAESTPAVETAQERA